MGHVGQGASRMMPVYHGWDVDLSAVLNARDHRRGYMYPTVESFTIVYMFLHGHGLVNIILSIDCTYKLLSAGQKARNHTATEF